MILPVLAKSQVWRDSLFLNPQASRVLEISLLRQGLGDSAIRSYGRVDLDYQRSEGAYRRAQEGFSKNRVAFYTAGARKLGRIGISGDFVFDKVYEDSLSSAIRSDQTLLSPFYYYAAKAGNYERQNYKANVTLSYDLIPGILIPFVQLNYGTHWSTGSVDPRLDSKRFLLKYNPGLTYRMKGGTAVSIMALKGSARENAGIAFKNDRFATSLTYPERIHYLSFGYGYLSIRDTSSLLKKTAYQGGELTFKKRIGSWNLLSFLRYERAKEESTHDLKSQKSYRIRAKFENNQYSGRFLFTKIGLGRDQQLDVRFSTLTGQDGHIDFSPTLSRVNYEVAQNTVDLSYSLIFNKRKRNQQELGFGVSYYEENRSDAAQSTRLDARILRLNPLFRSYIASSLSGMLVVKVAPFYSWPLQTALSVNPNSVNAFTRNVVYPDYYYFSSKVAGAQAGLSFLSKGLLKSNILEFSLDAEYSSRLSTAAESYPASFVPGKSRLQTMVGVKLLF